MSDANPDKQNQVGGNDGDLRQAFETLRSEDAQLSPEFFVPELTAGERRHSWRLRPAIPVAVLAVVLALTSLTVFHRDRGDADSHAAAAAVDAIKFDELSEMVSRELFAAAVDDWHAPSDFLLEPIDP